MNSNEKFGPTNGNNNSIYSYNVVEGQEWEKEHVRMDDNSSWRQTEIIFLRDQGHKGVVFMGYSTDPCGSIKVSGDTRFEEAKIINKCMWIKLKVKLTNFSRKR